MPIFVLVSIVVSIPACHAGDLGSIPRRGDVLYFSSEALKLWFLEQLTYINHKNVAI